MDALRCACMRRTATAKEDDICRYLAGRRGATVNGQTRKGQHVSELNPSADSAEAPSPFGSAPDTTGSSGASEQVGSAPPAADETVGSAPPPAAGTPGDTGAPGAPAAAETKKGNTALAWVVGAVVVIALALGVGWLFG